MEGLEAPKTSDRASTSRSNGVLGEGDYDMEIFEELCAA